MQAPSFINCALYEDFNSLLKWAMFLAFTLSYVGALRCDDFGSDASVSALREAVRRNQPFTAHMSELAKYKDEVKEHWVRLLPEDSPMIVAVSQDSGFYGSFADNTSKVGMSRVWPYMVENVPWGAQKAIMRFQAERRQGKHPKMPDMHPKLMKILQVPSNTWYVNGQVNDDLWRALKTPELKPLFKRLKKVQASKEQLSRGKIEAPILNMWFSGGATVSNLHFDPSDNWMCQLAGEKTFTMFQPNESAKLYPINYGRNRDGKDYMTVWDESSGLLSKQLLDDGDEGDGNKVYAALNIRNVDLNRFPLYREARAWRCSIAAGQCIWIPQAWWHNIAAGDAAINLSLNFWFSVSDEEQLQNRGFDLTAHIDQLELLLKNTSVYLKKLKKAESRLQRRPRHTDL